MEFRTRLRAVLSACSLGVIVATGIAIVVPRPASVVIEAWVLPFLSLAALLLAAGLAADWPWLRWAVPVLGATLVVGWMRAGVATSIRHFAGASLGLLLMLTLGRILDTPSRLRLALLTFMGFGLVVVAVGFAATDMTDPSGARTAALSSIPTVRLPVPGLDSTGGRVNANALAAAALLVTSMALSLLLSRSTNRRDRVTLRPLALIVSLVGLVALAASRSRSAALAIWLTCGIVLIRGVNAWWARLMAGVVVVVGPLVAGAIALARTHDEFHLLADELWQTMDHRAGILRSGVALLTEAPWFGIGLNNFRHVYATDPTREVARVLPHVHNTFLQTALDVGVVGFAAYGVVLGFLLVTAARVTRGSDSLSRMTAVGGALLLVSVSLFGIGDALALGAKVGLIQWMAAGLILAASRTQSAAGQQ